MKVLIPEDIIDDTMLISSSIESDFDGVPEYDPETTYTEGTEVQYLHTKYTALSTSESNIGQTPGPSSAFWEEGDPDNRWAMFDSYVSTQTVGDVDEDIVVVLNADSVDSLALLNMENVLSVRVQREYVPSGEIVMDTTEQLIRYAQDAVSSSWWEYFFGEIEYRHQLFLNFDSWTQSQITITMTPVPGLAAKVGHCLIGQSKNIGKAQWGIVPSMTDYSKIIRDTDTGKTRLVQGNYAKNLTIPLVINNALLDKAFRDMTDVRGRPAVWNANENGTNWESMVSFGYIREFALTIPGANESTCNITVEGLI